MTVLTVVFSSPQHAPIRQYKPSNYRPKSTFFWPTGRYGVKMDTIWSAVCMISPGCYKASIDLKNVYYSVRVNPNHQKYLKFCWKVEGNYFNIHASVMVLPSAPRKFTKLRNRSLPPFVILGIGLLDLSMTRTHKGMIMNTAKKISVILIL
jgi:hypothetical protein